MVTARKQNLHTGMGKARVGRCRACAHDGHVQAWRTHTRNIYAHTTGFVDVGFVDVDATGSSKTSHGQLNNFSGLFLFCNAATQLATQLPQRRIQVVYSNKVARKCLTESNGTPAMDIGRMNTDSRIHSHIVLK